MKRITVFALAGILAISAVGCQNIETEEKEEKQLNNLPVAESSKPEAEVDSPFSFINFENLEFYFASGAGAWCTVLTIEEDGSFWGEYSDANMGSREYYLSNFEGQFAEPVKVNDYTYSMQITELNYAEDVGKEEIKDETTYIYDEAYGIAGTEEILIYLPGAPLAELSEEYKSWVSYEISLAGDDVTELPFYGLYNETQQCGFSSYDIVDHLYESIEGQKSLAADVEESLMNDDLNQGEMNELSYQLYQIWDVTLNEVWDVLKQTLSDDTMQTLLNEQREWIAHKEQEMENAAMEAGGGSMAPMVANQRAAELTKIRVYELLKYITSIDFYSQDAQIQLLIDNISLWKNEPEYANELWKCAVTDLDFDAKKEIIVANCGGTGCYTYSRIFEVNDIFDGLVEITNGFVEGDSQPDIIQEHVTAYWKSPYFYYVFTDNLKNGAGEHHKIESSVSLQETKFVTTPIVFKDSIYDIEKEVLVVTVKDADGKELPEDAYESEVQKYFDGYEKHECTIGWQDMRELSDNSEIMKEQLKESAEKFLIE